MVTFVGQKRVARDQPRRRLEGWDQRPPNSWDPLRTDTTKVRKSSVSGSGCWNFLNNFFTIVALQGFEINRLVEGQRRLASKDLVI